MAKIEKLAEEIAAPIAEERGLRVYDVEYKKEGGDWFLRIFLYGDKGVDLEDCEAVSRKMSEKLDEADPITDAYCLEISSPGLERTLSREWHFETAIGERVELRFYAPQNGKKTAEGILKAKNAAEITIETEEDGECRYKMDLVSKVRTVFDGKF